MSFALLERIAEEKIREAAARGDFDHLPGAGKPLPDEDDLALVPPELRMAYRVMKNAGYLPEEVRLRRDIEDVTRLLDLCEDQSPDFHEGLTRLHLLMQRLGEMRGGNLALHDRYYRQMAERFAPKRDGRESENR
ncbi:DnaJ family domain-containing protein [Methylomagnum sp.]